MQDGPEKTAFGEKLSADAAEKRRVFVGKTPDGAATLVLSDPQGRPRLVLTVDAAGTPRLETLNENGSVLERFPTKP